MMHTSVGGRAWVLSVALATVAWLQACDSKSPTPEGSGAGPSDEDPARTRATEAVLEEVVKPETLDHDVVVRATTEPLPAGTEVRSFGSGEYGTQATFETTEPTYLYFVDDSPYSLYGHPVRYALVAAKTAKVVKVIDHDFWPLVDGAYPFAAAPDDAIVFARVRSDHSAARDGGVAASASALEVAASANALSSDPACPPGHERTCYAIVVSGGGDVLGANIEADRTDWAEALRKPGGGCRADVREVSGATDPKGAVMALKQTLSDVAELAECCDRVTLVISAHGQRYKEQKNMDGGTDWLLWREGSPVEPGDNFFWGVWLGDNFMGAETIRGYIDRMWSCHVSVVNGACYSGGFVDVLKGDSKIETVIASTGSDETRQSFESKHGTTYLQGLLAAYRDAQAAGPSDLPDQVLERSVAPANAADPFVEGVETESGSKLTDHPEVRVRDANAVCACCGDGKQEAPEECDDGNLKEGDGCTSGCDLERDGGMAMDAGVPDAGAPDAGAPDTGTADAGATDSGMSTCLAAYEVCDIVSDGASGYVGNCCPGMKCAAGCYGGCAPGTCCQPVAQGSCVPDCVPEDCAMTSCYGCY